MNEPPPLVPPPPGIPPTTDLGGETAEDPGGESEDEIDSGEGEGEARAAASESALPPSAARSSSAQSQQVLATAAIAPLIEDTNRELESGSSDSLANVLEQDSFQTDSDETSSIRIASLDPSNSLGRSELRTDINSIASQIDVALLTRPGAMWNELDQQLRNVESQVQGDLIVVGAAGAAASSFTVGVVAWGLRTGFLASGLLAQMPAWQVMDPLMVMRGLQCVDDDTESLEDLMKRQSQSLDDATS